MISSTKINDNENPALSSGGRGVKVLFIDRDGTLVIEPADEQVDSFEKLEFYPKVFEYMGRIARELDYELVIVTNQDGLGTASLPETIFWPIQNFIIKAFENEGVKFNGVYIDKTFAKDNAPTRKPNTGLLTEFFDKEKYDLENSFVLGDRLTDVLLAKNLGSKAIWLNENRGLGDGEINEKAAELKEYIALETTDWAKIYEFLKLGERSVKHIRKTKETDISIELNLDGSGKAEISTGIHFFDHMLEQIARHGSIDLKVKTIGDLHIDEHHTIEDTGIALGEAFAKVLTDKRGMERYGFCLPMDDCLAQVAIDFGGRNWIVWDAEFKREKVGEMPTEMFFHFFKSFSDASHSNLNIKAEGLNEHHKIEAIFKAFAKAIKMAVKRDATNLALPSTKGVL
ncbi:bifunctional histidinol-phosphatase/imidazoleglycerol-phosphate dehydratase HisB [Solitalea canadensis]|uniref:Histidine biosynthesis bifunctional protein HisB n=1 Tax=Solitalea canadensis (strain ATCC 29591 / DSM 3403 / JCM 21819 / LMG 8368 / NBRC 15130 / NCIMB 12057 / USAM 9D) TaxID=929556 RepID=H8KV40_SOLCM|nr:bifunctional histidinol-phosphatase/imidazoleglycerol-phosphate dehydratase HisB [Solitalea canadensis]AFD06040.1 histidinol-phosphatase [Solitalea canadensis DSM 3403]